MCHRQTVSLYIRKSNGVKMEPCGTAASTDDQLEY